VTRTRYGDALIGAPARERRAGVTERALSRGDQRNYAGYLAIAEWPVSHALSKKRNSPMFHTCDQGLLTATHPSCHFIGDVRCGTRYDPERIWGEVLGWPNGGRREPLLYRRLN
jgi:hypothetical protein